MAENARISVSTVRNSGLIFLSEILTSVFVNRLDFFNGIQIGQSIGAVFRIQRIVDGKLDVVGGHLLAVVKLHSFTQVKGIEFPVFGDFPGLRKARLNRSLGIPAKQTAQT